MLPLYKAIFQHADIVQSISYYLADFAQKMGFNGNIQVIPNAVETKHFSREYTEEELSALKKKLHKKENDIFLITTSRLASKNALEDVIKALQFLPQNVKFLILGQGHEEKTLQKLSRDLDLQSRVKFLGFIEHKDIPKYLKISDIFIRPSLSEGFGNSFVEAMAASIPVIATPVGGIVDFLFDPDKNIDKDPTGLFCKVRDPRDIAYQVTRLLQNPALREQIIISAKKMVFEKYDWDIIAGDIKEKIFDKVIGDV